MPRRPLKIVRAAGATSTEVRRIKIEVILDEIGAALDVWAANQPDPKPSRAEAVRRLINQALGRQ